MEVTQNERTQPEDEIMETDISTNENPPKDVIDPIKQQQQECIQENNEIPLKGINVQSIEPDEEDMDDEDDDDYDEDDEGEDIDDDDDDDEEEKENSQKLVIDINDEEEEEDEAEEENAGNEVEEVKITVEEKPSTAIVQNIVPNVSEEKAIVKKTPPIEEKMEPNAPIGEEAIITLSDGEEELSLADVNSKPGKIQKRKSVGAPPLGGNADEQRFRLKRRKINVEGAPKMPLTGYVRYMNDRRESARKENPNKTNIEITKQIGEEWQTLPGNIKADYLEAAEKDKKRYTSELHTFLKSRPDILASELAKNKKNKTDNTASSSSNNNAKLPAKEKISGTEIPKVPKESLKEKSITKDPPQTGEKIQIPEKVTKRKHSPTPPSASVIANATVAPTVAAISSASATALGISANIITPTPGEIPIFTNEFLEHNKLYDMELRSLRKSKTDLEQQNFVLEKHVENMKCGVEKMVAENNEIQEKNRLLEIYLDKLKRKLAHALGSLPLPNAPNGATMDNIDKYMQDLYKMSTSNSHGPATLNKAKDIIRKLDLQIQL